MPSKEHQIHGQFGSWMNKGFSMVFSNNVGISVQWGRGNYCDNRHDDKDRPMYCMRPDQNGNVPEYTAGCAEVHVENIPPRIAFNDQDNDKKIRGYLTPDEVADIIQRCRMYKPGDE